MLNFIYLNKRNNIDDWGKSFGVASIGVLKIGLFGFITSSAININPDSGNTSYITILT